jgi:hypothetical protein
MIEVIVQKVEGATEESVFLGRRLETIQTAMRQGFLQQELYRFQVQLLIRAPLKDMAEWMCANFILNTSPLQYGAPSSGEVSTVQKGDLVSFYHTWKTYVERKGSPALLEAVDQAFKTALPRVWQLLCDFT